MPKQPTAVELEAINREGETQVVRGDARLHCVDEWADYEPEVIELEEFLDIWINDLDEDDVLVGPNWNADLEGQELEPIELAKALVELDA